MSTKHLPLLVKSTDTRRDLGTFVAIASTFGGAPDHQGDVIDRHAFDVTIAEWKARGGGPPLSYMHSYLSGDPESAIGAVTHLKATDEGLMVTGRLDLDDPMARAVWERMKTGSLSELSIGYLLRSSKTRKDRAELLLDIDLREIAIVKRGANPNTSFLDMKGAPGAEPEILTGTYREIVRDPSTGLITGVVEHKASPAARPRPQPAPKPVRRPASVTDIAEAEAQREHDRQYERVPQKSSPAIPQAVTPAELRDEWLAKSADDPVMQDLVRVCFNGEPTKAEAARLRRKAAEAEVRRLCDALTTMGVQSPDDVRARAADAAADRERDLQRKDAERQREAELREADRMFAANDFHRRVSRVAITGAK